MHEVDRLMSDEQKREEMKKAAAEFFVPNAAKKIARAITEIVLSHEK